MVKIELGPDLYLICVREGGDMKVSLLMVNQSYFAETKDSD